jgi:hypothetical protein
MMVDLEWFGEHLALIDPAEAYHHHSPEQAIESTKRMLAMMPDEHTMMPMGHYWSDGSLVAQITATGRGVLGRGFGFEMDSEVAAFTGGDPDKARLFVDVAMLYWPFIAANEQVDEMMIALDANVRLGGTGEFPETLIFNHLKPGSTDLAMHSYRRDDSGTIVEWDEPITGIDGNVGGRIGMMAESVTKVRLQNKQDESHELEIIIAGLIEERAAQVMLPREEPWTSLTEHLRSSPT